MTTDDTTRWPLLAIRFLLTLTALQIFPAAEFAMVHPGALAAGFSATLFRQQVPQTTNSPDSFCPINCTCQSTKVQCIQVVSFPIIFPIHTTSLALIGITNETLTEKKLRKLPNLTALSVVKSGKLRRISSGLFRSFTSLELLNLSANSVFESLAPQQFSVLSRLKTLNLSANALRSVLNESFTGLNRLENLDLSRNRISHIETGSFLQLALLQTLDLSGNLITNLSQSWFTKLANLEILLIAENRIIRIENFIFEPLNKLQVLDISGNDLVSISPNSLSGLAKVKFLNAMSNNITSIDENQFRPLQNLEYINLSANRISVVKFSPFSYNSNLRTIVLDSLPNLTTVDKSAFQALEHLTELSISRNPRLNHVHPEAFQSMPSLKTLDLSTNNLSFLHWKLFSNLEDLSELSLDKNPWRCDCFMQWFPQWLNKTKIRIWNSSESICSSPEEMAGKLLDGEELAQELNCTDAVILSHSTEVYSRLGATALLECQASGNPQPSLTWILPKNHNVFHLYPPDAESHWYLPYQKDHPYVHGRNSSVLSVELARRIRVLKNGNLYISKVLSVDAGTYLCLASNTFSNDTARITLTLNYQILIHVKLISILVGLATSIAMLLLLLIFQLINMALNRWGCCCCQGVVSPKAKQIRKMLETIEQYKSQQLEKLRENYAMQVNRIKDNCTQQMDRIRDSYGTQVDRFRDIRDFGTQQLDKVRDQYYEQVKKVRDYSSQQMSKVRENYIFQRNRIRKFSAHQLIRLRENYKLQQQHLNKILETLNIESCRTGCSRSQSLDFSAEVDVLEPVFSTNLSALPIPFLPDEVSLGSDNNSDYFTPVDSRTPSCDSFPTTSPPDSPNKSSEDHQTASGYVKPIEEINEPSTPLAGEEDCKIDIVEDDGITEKKEDIADCGDTPAVVLLVASPNLGCKEENESNSKETTV